ncbi:Hypothetical protein D9617_12g035350 [Elsinoe fawcettii]|nr:Hypothetical protein D9617_12g035350 [Elsinoe fawcettii]
MGFAPGLDGVTKDVRPKPRKQTVDMVGVRTGAVQITITTPSPLLAELHSRRSHQRFLAGKEEIVTGGEQNVGIGESGDRATLTEGDACALGELEAW